MQDLSFPKINKPNLIQLLQQLVMMELNCKFKKKNLNKDEKKKKGKKRKKWKKERTWNLSLKFDYLTLCFSTCNITRVNNDWIIFHWLELWFRILLLLSFCFFMKKKEKKKKRKKKKEKEKKGKNSKGFNVVSIKVKTTPIINRRLITIRKKEDIKECCSRWNFPVQ